MIRRQLVLIFLVITVLALFSCGRGTLAKPETAITTLQTQGYSDIVITDHSWFAVSYRGCSDDDAARFTATATNPVGQKVEVYVCTGWPFKGGTIRTK